MSEELINQQKIQVKIITQWYNGVRIRHKSHFIMAIKYERNNIWLGAPVVILSAITGTSIFATFSTSPEPWVKILVGLLSITAAVLASLQTFLGLNKQAERHKFAAIKYGTLRRELEEKITIEAIEINPDQAFIEDFRKRWDALDQESPSIPSSVYDVWADYYEKKKI